MEVVYERCAGLDVHKKDVVACRIVPKEGKGWRKEVKRFGTMTEDLLLLTDWLKAGQVSHVAMESTGVYWKPVYNILEHEFEVMVVNARHIKFVPGRKTDVKDAQWIGELLQHGLLKASYIPDQPQRDLRELVRYRTNLVQERARELNRVQKVLEDANIKLASVVSDVMGVSARTMLQALIAGEDNPETLAEFAQKRMRSKLAELERALTGHIREAHRLLLRLHLQHIDDLSDKIDALSREIDRLIVPFDVDDLLRRLDDIPGVGRDVAQVIVAELGVDLARFPSAGHAASWAGLTPGKNESAGRNRSSKTRPGNKYLKTALVQAAHAAGRSKDTYLASQYRRLASRRGKKRAAMAVAHSLLVIAFHMIQRGTSYIDLGSDYFDQRSRDWLAHHLVRRLENLGHTVTLAPAA